MITSCSQQQKFVKQERKSWNYKSWKDDFKDRAFCLCLLEGYENKDIKEFILKNDKSYFSGIAPPIFDPVLNPIIQREIEEMKKDSLESIEKVSEGKAGKMIFNHCLEFYKSQRLDSLTKRQIPKWRRIENISEQVSKYNPTY